MTKEVETMKYYDVTFHELSGKTVVKRDIPSEKTALTYGKMPVQTIMRTNCLF